MRSHKLKITVINIFLIIILLGLSSSSYGENSSSSTSLNPSSHSSLGSSYYADISIFVSQSGFVTVTGDTNNEFFQSIQNSANFTSKKGNYWVLNITSNQVFENALFKIHLPKGSSVTYMKIPSFLRLEDSDDGLVIVGSAESKKLNIVIQYTFDPLESSGSLPPWWFYALISFILSSAIVFLRKKFRDDSFKVIPGRSFPKPRSHSFKRVDSVLSKNKSSSTTSPQSSSVQLTDSLFIFDQLPERQKIILQLIKESKKGYLTQAELEKKTGFPKSSLSRNVDALVRKDFISKTQNGMTNTLSLKIDL